MVRGIKGQMDKVVDVFCRGLVVDECADHSPTGVRTPHSVNSPALEIPDVLRKRQRSQSEQQLLQDVRQELAMQGESFRRIEERTGTQEVKLLALMEEVKSLQSTILSQQASSRASAANRSQAEHTD